MKITKQHRLNAARWVPSPNYNERPAGNLIELVVIHAISLPPGKYGGDFIERLFTNRLDPEEHPYFQEIYQLEVSAHLLIRRCGELVQFVPFDKRAWHAGQSCYQGRGNCNDFSIGIELEGCDSDEFEPVQYDRLAHVIQALAEHYPGVTTEAVTGHSDIAPGRKTDPGPRFDWDYLKQQLKKISSPS